MTQDQMPPKLINDIVRAGAMRTLEQARESDMWDCAPMIGLVADVDGEALCIHVPVPDDYWRAAPVPIVVRTIGAAVGNGLITLQLDVPTESIRGLVLITEGHAVDGGELNEAEKASLREFTARHRVEEHNKSRELRMAHMIDRSLTQALGRHFRGDPVSERIIYGFTGNIPTAMEELMTAILASWISEAETTT
jgi:hypothetical protein